MEYNNPSDIVKDLKFGDDAKDKILLGVQKLSDAVQSTLGASGTCVIFEDGTGKPVITKDGVTVSESVVLYDPVENIGARLIKEAAKNTVKTAGDGTSTSTVLARYILEELYKSKASLRDLKAGLESGSKKVYQALEDMAIEVTDEILSYVATISCNNDSELGGIIGDAFAKVGKDGVVLIEDSETNETYSDIVDGIQFDSKLKSPYLATDKSKTVSEMKDALVLISSSTIPHVRNIKNILEYVADNNKPLLIVADVEQQVMQLLMANKVKGNLKINIIDPPGFGSTKQDTLEDLATLTGTKVFSEDLGDDMDLIEIDDLGQVSKVITDDKSTTITIEGVSEGVSERVKDVRDKIEEEENPFIVKKLEQRLAMLSGKVGVVYVGADSEVELKEKRDRVDDAVHATKAALRGGIISGGGVALKDAVKLLDSSVEGERVLIDALMMPMKVILQNAHIKHNGLMKLPKGIGVNAVTGNEENMVDSNIVDPLYVTTTALRNALSVASTIISANCVISNMRHYNE